MATDAPHLRADAERNREAILAAAVAVLAETPEATMAEIAAASGIGRSTLYRHFPDRAALAEAILDRVVNEAEAIIAESFEDADPAEAQEVLTEVIVRLAGLGERYHFLEREEARRHAKQRVRERGPGRPLREFVARAQRTGAIRDDLPGEWLIKMLGNMIHVAAMHPFADAAARRATVAATVEALIQTPAPRRSAPSRAGR